MSTIQSSSNKVDLAFYYTGAKEYKGNQLGPSTSLGGYISNVIVPNEQIFNLWADIAVLSTEERNTKAIVLENISENTATDLKFWCGNYKREDFFWIEIGVVELIDGQMQIINSPYELPRDVEFFKYYLLPTSKLTGDVIPEDEVEDWEINNPGDVVLYDPDNINNDNNIFEFPQPVLPGEMFGLWIKRVVDYDKLKDAFRCDSLYKEYKSQLEEKFNLPSGEKQNAINKCQLIFNNKERAECLAEVEKKYGVSQEESMTTKDLAPIASSILGNTGIYIEFDYLDTKGNSGLYLKATDGFLVVP